MKNRRGRVREKRKHLPANPKILETPRDIPRFGSFVNQQLDNIAASNVNNRQNRSLDLQNLFCSPCSTRLQKTTMIQEG